MPEEQVPVSDPLLVLPQRLLRACSEEPLISIAAVRVLRRLPWQGAALQTARQYFYDVCSPSLREEASRSEFFPRAELRPIVTDTLRTNRWANQLRARRVLTRSVRYFKRRLATSPLEPAQEQALREALQFLAASPRDDTWFSRNRIEPLSPEDLGYLVTGAFARTLFSAYDDDPDARQALGNEIVKVTWSARQHVGQHMFYLFEIYQALFGPAQQFWMRWQQEYEGKLLPNFIPTRAGHLSVSWQVAWAASAAGPEQLMRFLTQALSLRNPTQRLAALNFTELMLRYGREQGTPEFGGGTVAPDIAGIDEPYELSPDVSLPRPVPSSAPPTAVIHEQRKGPIARIGDKVAELVTDLLSEVVVFHKAPPQETKEARPTTASAPPEDTGEHAIPQKEKLKKGAASEAVGAGATSGEPGKRHADFTFYRRRTPTHPRAKVGDHEPLAKTETYDLEVAIRGKRTGIPPRKKRLDPGIIEPQQGTPVDILVIATSRDFEIPEPVQRLSLPPFGDSVLNAVFKKLVPPKTTPSATDLAKIDLRLLYNLNLIEHAVIEAEVVPTLEIPGASKLGLHDPVYFDQDSTLRSFASFELIQPRQMNIFVSRVSGGFELSFTLLREDRPLEVLTGTTHIPEEGLGAALAEIRKKLLGIAVWDEFGCQVECGDAEKFQDGLRKLAESGRDFWTKLFKYKVDSSLSVIGKFLTDHPLPSRSLVQVSIDDTASSFVLPWNLLYDRDLNEGPVDPQGFWGMRYRIEQESVAEAERNDACTRLSKPLEIGFLVSKFQEAALQQKFLLESVIASGGRIADVLSIDSATEAFDYLKHHAGQCVFFFAHGHTFFPGVGQVGFSEADFLQLYNALPPNSALRGSWRDLYESVSKKQYDSDKSWIKLQYGKLFLNDLYGQVVEKFPGAPLVFLNMCESAQLTPSVQDSFIHFFLDRGARVVIGTECSMRPLFAHHFAKEFLESVLAGEAVGDALLEARAAFMAKNNPLGLAYTLFGSPLTRFDPPPLDENQGHGGRTIQ